MNAVRNRRPEPPTLGDLIGEIRPLIGVVFVAGPSVIVLAGGVVMLSLLLAGPFLLLVTLAVSTIVTTLLVAAVIAAPYLVVRSVYRQIASWHRATARRVVKGTAQIGRPTVPSGVPVLVRPTTARGPR